MSTWSLLPELRQNDLSTNDDNRWSQDREGGCNATGALYVIRQPQGHNLNLNLPWKVRQHCLTAFAYFFIDTGITFKYDSYYELWLLHHIPLMKSIFTAYYDVKSISASIFIVFVREQFLADLHLIWAGEPLIINSSKCSSPNWTSLWFFWEQQSSNYLASSNDNGQVLMLRKCCVSLFGSTMLASSGWPWANLGHLKVIAPI